MSVQEKLIELVRPETVLYDTKHVDYMKKSLKDSIWLRIAKELKIKNGAAAKAMWLKLRNCHRDALRRKISKGSGGGTTSSGLKPWKFENQMQFLITYMTNRLTTDQLNLEHEEYEDCDDPLEVVYDVAESQPDEPRANEQKSGSESSGADGGGGGLSKKKPRKSTIDDILLKTLQRHEEWSRNRARRTRWNNNDSDELFHFFMTIYKTTKKMPHISQIKLKRKLFDLVSDEEEFLITNTNRLPSDARSCAASSCTTPLPPSECSSEAADVKPWPTTT